MSVDENCQIMAPKQKISDTNSKIKLYDTLFLKSTNGKSLPDCT